MNYPQAGNNGLAGPDVMALYELSARNGDIPAFAGGFNLAGQEVFKAGTVSTLSGAINTVYGAPVYDLVNRQQNGHAIIKKGPWLKSGYRNVSSNPTTKLYGGADPSTVGAVIDVSVNTRSTFPGYVHTPFDLTLDAAFRARHDDGLDVWDWKLAIMRDIHAQGLDEQWMKSVHAEAAAGATTDAKNNGTGVGIESLDRYISSQTEAASDSGNDASWYGVYQLQITRSAGSGAAKENSVVLRPDGTAPPAGASFASQSFQLAGLDTLITTTEKNGGDPKASIIFTGYDSRQKIENVFVGGGRYDATYSQAKLDMQGLSLTGTHDGRDITYTVRTYRTRPVVVDLVAPRELDATSQSERIFVLDQRMIDIQAGFPTIYAEVDNPIIRNSFDTRALFLTAEQPYVRRFNTSGKIIGVTL